MDDLRWSQHHHLMEALRWPKHYNWVTFKSMSLEYFTEFFKTSWDDIATLWVIVITMKELIF